MTAPMLALLNAIVDSDNRQSRAANADMLAKDIADLAKAQRPEVGAPMLWLLSHCSAIGMKDKSIQGTPECDIALFTIQLKDRAEKAERELAAFSPQKPTFWCTDVARFGSGDCTKQCDNCRDHVNPKWGSV